MNHFEAIIKDKFGEESVEHVLNALEELQITPPELIGQFLKGYDGAIILDTDYAVAVRIERRDYSFEDHRIVDPHMVDPIFQREFGPFTVEICPGLDVRSQEESQEASDLIVGKMKENGITVTDEGARQVGFMPVQTEEFPNGKPVYIDRLMAVYDDRSRMGQETELPADDDQKIYKPLKDAFALAWPKGEIKADPEAVEAAWKKCKEFKENGVLIAGWTNENINRIAEFSGKKAKAYQEFTNGK